MNQYESAAMWSLYGGKGDSIAVQTTYKTLFDSLPENTHVGMVQYIDYNSEEMPEWNGFTPFMYKRASYKHETEVRAIIKLRDVTAADPDPLPEKGVWIPVDLRHIIKAVRIAPASPNWLIDLIGDVSLKYGFQFDVKRSEMDEEPFY